MSPDFAYETEKISITLPSSLIEIIDHLAESRGYSRSGFIRIAIENQVLIQTKDRDILQAVYDKVAKP